MGTNGRNNNDKSMGEEKIPFRRVPVEKPPFTILQIKRAIPHRCFQRSLIRSFSHVVFNLCLSSLFYYIATSYILLLPYPLTFIVWPIYWVIQGCVLMRFWLIGHECGHHAFSNHQWIDDTIGFILHSTLLTPYFSWKYSHRRHHSNTGSIEHDEVFIPNLKSTVPWYTIYLNNPPGRVVSVVVSLIATWPFYLAFNYMGRKYDRHASHFYPYSPIYSDHERLQIFVSDAAIFATICLLYMAAASKGLVWLICIYGAPLLVVNGLIILAAFLNHTHLSLPHFNSSEWYWLRGALSTIDRDFGILNKVFFNVTKTHVVHHLFSSIPHYHANEATEAIKPILGDYYRCDATPFYKAFWRETKECLYVEPGEDANSKGIFWYHSKF